MIIIFITIQNFNMTKIYQSSWIIPTHDIHFILFYDDSKNKNKQDPRRLNIDTKHKQFT